MVFDTWINFIDLCQQEVVSLLPITPKYWQVIFKYNFQKTTTTTYITELIIKKTTLTFKMHNSVECTVSSRSISPEMTWMATHGSIHTLVLCWRQSNDLIMTLQTLSLSLSLSVSLSLTENKSIIDQGMSWPVEADADCSSTLVFLCI